jgi:hypothetical protein
MIDYQIFRTFLDSERDDFLDILIPILPIDSVLTYFSMEKT